MTEIDRKQCPSWAFSVFKSNYDFVKKSSIYWNVTFWMLLIEQNSCDFLYCALNSINHVNGECDWNGVRVEISKMSACRFVKSKNQKELHGVPWRCWNWDWISLVPNCRREQSLWLRVVVAFYCLFYSVVIVENVVCWSRCTVCQINAPPAV